MHIAATCSNGHVIMQLKYTLWICTLTDVHIISCQHWSKYLLKWCVFWHSGMTRVTPVSQRAHRPVLSRVRTRLLTSNMKSLHEEVSLAVTGIFILVIIIIMILSSLSSFLYSAIREATEVLENYAGRLLHMTSKSSIWEWVTREIIWNNH